MNGLSQVCAIRDDNVMKTTSCLLKTIMCEVEKLIDAYAHHPQPDKVFGGLNSSLSQMYTDNMFVFQHIKVPPTCLKISVQKTLHQVKFI